MQGWLRACPTWREHVGNRPWFTAAPVSRSDVAPRTMIDSSEIDREGKEYENFLMLHVCRFLALRDNDRGRGVSGEG